jgi:hypothetical protein
MDVIGSTFIRMRSACLVVLCALGLVGGARAAGTEDSLPVRAAAPLVHLTSARGVETDVAARYVLPIQLGAAPSSASASLDALPPPPNSIVMGIGALGCLGAVQLTRSIRRLAWSHAPDWYHAGAPSRIGHVKLFELDAIDIEPVFGFVLPATSSLERPWLERCMLPTPPLIPTRAPRSPPAAALCA